MIFINQLRMKIGVMMPGQSPETTTGGNALKFYASVRLDIRRIGAIKKGDEIIGNQTKIKVVKNKLAPPFKQVITEILYGEGISREGELIDMGVDAKLVERPAPGTAMVKSALARARTMPAATCATTRPSPPSSRPSCVKFQPAEAAREEGDDEGDDEGLLWGRAAPSVTSPCPAGSNRPGDGQGAKDGATLEHRCPTPKTFPPAASAGSVSRLPSNGRWACWSAASTRARNSPAS